jgi:hypothetical protein
MQSIRIVLAATMLALPAVACGPSHHDTPPDDAGPAPVFDAMPRPDAGPAPDAAVDAGAAAMRVRAGTVSGGVKASSAHYKLIGTTSEGGNAPSSPSYRLRQGVNAEKP